MKDKIKVFIEKEAFERFILNEHSFNNLLAIFSEHSLICLNMTDADIDKNGKRHLLMVNEGEVRFGNFVWHSMRRPQSAHSDFEKFLNDNNKLLDYSRSILYEHIT
jgi:hypothetical protein